MDAALDALIARAIAADAAPPFSDRSLVDLETGARSLVSLDPAAVALVGEKEFELLVDPDARRRGHGTRLLEHLVASPNRPLLAWAHGDHPGSRALAARFGFEAVRELRQLRAEVTVGEVASTGSPLESFDAGRDADAWVDLNARAFAAHPEQGRVTRAELERLMRKDWFAPADFLLLRDGDDLIGYCWLKVEQEMGEFYVVGVGPDRQGQGIGRELVAAGLAHLAGRGIHTASLYVDGDNEAALALYRSFGFERFAVDIQYSLPH